MGIVKFMIEEDYIHKTRLYKHSRHYEKYKSPIPQKSSIAAVVS